MIESFAFGLKCTTVCIIKFVSMTGDGEAGGSGVSIAIKIFNKGV